MMRSERTVASHTLRRSTGSEDEGPVWAVLAGRQRLLKGALAAPANIRFVPLADDEPQQPMASD